MLRTYYTRWLRRTCTSATTKFTNDRHLNTPQRKNKLQGLRARAIGAERKVKRLQTIIGVMAERNGVSIDPGLSQDLVTIMEDEVTKAYPPGSFRRLFWDQQLQAARANKANGIRWHPVMIRWALNLKMISSAAYHAMRTSGFLKLPSERLLRDYTHIFEVKCGFQREMNQQLMADAKVNELDETQKHVIIAFDEMHIKEDLVFSKHSGEVVGFVNLGDFEKQLGELENACITEEKLQHPAIATHLLVLMVRGLFTRIKYPFLLR